MDTNGEWLDANESGTLYGYVIEWEGSALMPSSFGTIVNGDNGTDIITGGAGGDTLNGGAGNDTITAVGTGNSTILSSDFTTGVDSFVYLDDNTDQLAGNDTDGDVTVTGSHQTGDGGDADGALQVAIDTTATHASASGSYSKAFNVVGGATGVQLDISYRHFHDINNETGEWSRVHVMIDGYYYNAASGSSNAGGAEVTYYLSQLTGEGAVADTGWVSLTINIGTLSAGSHTLTLGIFQLRRQRRQRRFPRPLRRYRADGEHGARQHHRHQRRQRAGHADRRHRGRPLPL